MDENQDEIAILKTMGASPGDLRLVFILHGMMVCISGLALGLALGLLMTFSLESVYAQISDLFALNLMSEYFIRYLPVDVHLQDVLMITGVSLVICFLATIYPASRAARANPVEILAYDV